MLGDLITASVPDLPGHNGSPLPDRLDQTGFLEVIDELSALAGAGTIVAGYSQGARIGLTLACRQGMKIRAIILESGSPGIHRAKDRAARLALDETRAATIERIGVEGFMDSWEKLPMFEGLRRLAPGIKEGVRDRRTGHTAAGLAGAFRALGTAVQPSNWQRLPGLDIPVLIVTGSKDRKFSRIGARMRKRMPNARQVSLRGSWHAPHLENPEGYASAFRSFLDAM